MFKYNKRLWVEGIVRFGRLEAGERGGFFPYGEWVGRAVLVPCIKIRVGCIRNPLIFGLSGKEAVGEEG